MRKIFLMLMLTICAAAFAAGKGATAEFKAKQHDFGTVSEGGPMVECEFEFTNTGDSPLVIISAKSACGCTRPTYPPEPIGPGESGKIRVQFNPRNQLGEVHKSVTVRTNDKKHKKIVLQITGLVKQ
ncbi:MAG: DUF1573 domain-containing protein [Clostridium sp.]|nr:DUF1573 domain-containing protein [Clostridium sp.]